MIGKCFIGAALLWALAPLPTKAQGAKARPKAASSKTAAASKASIAAGGAVYAEHCLTCHQPDGGGVGNLNPPLINTAFVNGDKARLINIVLNGMSGQEIDGEMYHNTMPAFAHLTDKQIADVLSYVRSSFGNKESSIKPAEVKIQRTKK